jgi:hypothetical protein
MSEETRERSFDELAKGLASGTLSRGKALRLMGAALVGGALASLPGAAWASHKGTPHGGGGGGGGGGGKSSCAKYCKTLFGGDTASQEECVSQGTKGTGPCYSCTQGAGPGPNFVEPSCSQGQEFDASSCKCAYCRTQGGVTHCCPADEGFTAGSVCINPSGGGTCCAAGEDCNELDGTCCENLCVTTCCAPGLSCDRNNRRCCERPCYGSGECCAPGQRCIVVDDESLYEYCG